MTAKVIWPWFIFMWYITCLYTMMQREQVSITLDHLCWRLYKEEKRKSKKFTRILAFQYINFQKHWQRVIEYPNSWYNKTSWISQTSEQHTQVTSRNTTEGKRKRNCDKLVADYGLLLLFGGGEDPPPPG